MAKYTSNNNLISFNTKNISKSCNCNNSKVNNYRNKINNINSNTSNNRHQNK